VFAPALEQSLGPLGQRLGQGAEGSAGQRARVLGALAVAARLAEDEKLRRQVGRTLGEIRAATGRAQPKKRRSRAPYVLVGLAAGAGAVYLVRRRRSQNGMHATSDSTDTTVSMPGADL
jgi:hypothetical protein